VVIFLGNTLILLIALPWLTGTVDFLTVLKWWLNSIAAIYKAIWALRP